MKKRLLTALLSGALILTALAGCGQVAENQSGANDASAGGESGARDELIFVNYRDIRDLNPHLYAGEMYAQSILYDTLVSNTREGYVGCLAEVPSHPRRAGWWTGSVKCCMGIIFSYSIP